MFEKTSLTEIEFSEQKDFEKILETAKKVHYAYFKNEESITEENFSVARVWGRKGKKVRFFT